jgi:predicted permease
MFERLYRFLLRWLPGDFRERFGAEMLDTARALDADRPRGAWKTVRAVSDAVTTPISLRAELRRDRRRLAPGTRTIPMESLLRDIAFTVRGLRRDPSFTVFVCIALALGIGANAAMFGIADRLLLSGPTHVRDAGRVVRLYSTERPAGMRDFTTSGFGYVTFDLLRRDAKAFEQVATFARNDAVAGRGADARTVKVAFTSASLFSLLGVRPALGRFFTEAEDPPTGVSGVVVLGDGAWRDWFGAAADAVGRTVTVNDEPLEVIGVAPPGFTGPQLGRVDLWRPGNALAVRVTNNFQSAWNSQWLQVIGRLAPGVTMEQASAEATAVHRRGYTGGEPSSAQARLHVAPLGANDAGTDSVEVRVLRWLTGVTLVVLLIACANIANLLLARGVRRTREVAIRAALGAARWRLVRLLIIESVLLSLAGAAAGLLVAHVVGNAARQALFEAIEWPTPPVDVRVLIACAGLAMITGLLMGALPAWRASRGDVSAALRTGVREGGGRRSRLRTTLTVTQAALSVVLLVGAGLFVKSLWTVRTLDLGVDADRILVVETTRASLASIPAGPSREAERQRRRVFFFDALERVRAVPGVEQASVAIGTPFGNRFTVKLRVADRADVPRLPGGGPGISAVTEGYFETAGTPIRRGRAFTPEDGPGTEPVAIVSELMAKTLWPGGDPIGRCLLIGDGTPACARIVGVAGNTYRSRLREDPVMHYYIPAGQEVGFGGAALLVRTADTTGAVSGEIRRLLTGLDGSITYVTAETMQSRIDPQMRPWRLGATVFALSGLLALVVAGIGIYSVMSYLVADRRGEISVRLALGAQSRDIMRLVLRGSLLMAVAGVVIGELMAASLGRFVEPLLFNTSPRDPVVLAGIGGLLVAVALVGTLMPALRARRINAIDALKGP